VSLRHRLAQLRHTDAVFHCRLSATNVSEHQAPVHCDLITIPLDIGAALSLPLLCHPSASFPFSFNSILNTCGYLIKRSARPWKGGSNRSIFGLSVPICFLLAFCI
jgi:hypothetical protein